uniref:Leucine-rich repeat-containing N-terminal plant-type domain-containing protein n=1 Tax=Nelumbo nucifera TaxID=4432 RepID=A0A822ZCZ2_NELNU|nr:TPA_asm: hypothetical protein HUJ06_000653 [Nelumbo nucifera]
MGMFSAFGQILLILCLLSRKLVCNADTPCSESDRKALVDFRNGLRDPENRLSPWNGNDCCQYGFWNLSGQIDPALLRLKSLSYLDLSLNTFQGIPIPNFIGSLKRLRYLNLSDAGFSALAVDDIKWVAGLGLLRNLALNGVDLSPVWSDWVQVLNNLPLLNELHLSGCGIFSPIPSLQSVNFTSLTVIDLSFNNFDSKFPDWIVNVSSLLSLDMSNAGLNGKIPLGISELPNL